jgi:hypothetical protein
MPCGHISGSEIFVHKQEQKSFFSLLWFNIEILALVTTLPLYILLLYEKIRFYKIKFIVLFSLCIYTKVTFILFISNTQFVVKEK